MFTRFSKSWQLVKASANVLQANKKLLVFPLISMIGVIIVSITFAVPVLLSGFLDRMVSGNASDNTGIFGLIIGLAFYLVMYTVIYFSNTALVGCVMLYFRGHQPTLGDGLRIAREHFGSILLYALISATVGMILRSIAERGIIGRIIASLIGFTWSIATFLVIPVLVIEDVSPVDAIKRSGELLKKTWGEQLAASLSMGGIFALIMLAAVAVWVGLAMLVGATGSAGLVGVFIIGLPVLFVFMIVLGLISSALTGIYKAALYQYATEGDTHGYFDPELIQHAFKSKRGA